MWNRSLGNVYSGGFNLKGSDIVCEFPLNLKGFKMLFILLRYSWLCEGFSVVAESEGFPGLWCGGLLMVAPSLWGHSALRYVASWKLRRTACMFAAWNLLGPEGELMPLLHWLGGLLTAGPPGKSPQWDFEHPLPLPNQMFLSFQAFHWSPVGGTGTFAHCHGHCQDSP